MPPFVRGHGTSNPSPSAIGYVFEGKSSEGDADAQAQLAYPLFCHPLKGGNDEGESFMQFESRGREWRMPIIHEGTAHP
jgi:hypothetical protein